MSAYQQGREPILEGAVMCFAASVALALALTIVSCADAPRDVRPAAGMMTLETRSMQIARDANFHPVLAGMPLVTGR